MKYWVTCRVCGADTGLCDGYSNALMAWEEKKLRTPAQAIYRADALAPFCAELQGARLRITQLTAALEDALAWHEAAGKALSKQPPSDDSRWRRHQHQEQRDTIRAILGGNSADA